MDLEKIFEHIKPLLKSYFQAKKFWAFISLDSFVLLGYKMIKISYNSNSDTSGFVVELVKGDYDWIIVIILLIINTPFIIWLDNIRIQNKQCKIKVGYFFKEDTSALSPSFEKIITSFSIKTHSIHPQTADPLVGLSSIQAVLANMARTNNAPQITNIQVIKGEINKSFYPIQFYLKNIGKPSLKSFEITFCFGDDVSEIKSNNKKMNGIFNLEFPSPSSTYIDEEEKTVLLKGRNMLVGGNNIATKPIFVKPSYPIDKITIHWELLADEFNQTGSFEVPVSYNIIETYKDRYVDTPDELQNDIEDICDYIESIT